MDLIAFTKDGLNRYLRSKGMDCNVDGLPEIGQRRLLQLFITVGLPCYKNLYNRRVTIFDSPLEPSQKSYNFNPFKICYMDDLYNKSELRDTLICDSNGNMILPGHILIPRTKPCIFIGSGSDLDVPEY